MKRTMITEARGVFLGVNDYRETLYSAHADNTREASYLASD